MKTHTIPEACLKQPQEELDALRHMGFEDVIVHEDSSVSVTLQTGAYHMNNHGSILGSVEFMVCDAAIGAYLLNHDCPGVGTEASIHFYRAAREGDVLTATVFERKRGRTLGTFLIELKNQDDVHIADVCYSIMFNL